MFKKFSSFALIFCLWPLGALAEASSTYSPEHCEFSVTFPSEPSIAKRCDDENKTRCYDQVSYTHTFKMTSTVNFRVICSPIGKEVHENYSAEVMEATLRAMTDKNVIKTFDTSFREEAGYKQAGLVGEGQQGRMSTIYIAQLWIGSRSAFSVEAELLGVADDEADRLFSDVMKSVKYKAEPKTEDVKKETKNRKDKQEAVKKN